MSNVFKTGLLLAVLTVMLVLIGGAIGGRQGMLIAFFVALAMNFVSYWFSDKMVLAAYGAQPIEEASAPRLYAIVHRLATRAGIPMPRVYLIPSETPNAFATGRNPEHAVVAVTEGIMRILDEEELEGVLAHELSHVKNRDVLISTVAATLAGAITYLAHMAQWAAMFGGRSPRDRASIHRESAERSDADASLLDSPTSGRADRPSSCDESLAEPVSRKSARRGRPGALWSQAFSTM